MFIKILQLQPFSNKRPTPQKFLIVLLSLYLLWTIDAMITIVTILLCISNKYKRVRFFKKNTHTKVTKSVISYIHMIYL